MKISDLKNYSSFIRNICNIRQWEKDWSRGGCYTHLEVSEFIEAVRGKGDPIDELGDVLFTILAVADYYGVDPEVAIQHNIEKHQRLLKEDGLL